MIPIPPRSGGYPTLPLLFLYQPKTAGAPSLLSSRATAAKRRKSKGLLLVFLGARVGDDEPQSACSSSVQVRAECPRSGLLGLGLESTLVVGRRNPMIGFFESHVSKRREMGQPIIWGWLVVSHPPETRFVLRTAAMRRISTNSWGGELICLSPQLKVPRSHQTMCSVSGGAP
jgi:hypothetical protein